MPWYGWLLMWCGSGAYLLCFVIRAHVSYVALCHERASLERCLDLLIEWRRARPFLWVGQSEYAQGLVHRMMRATRILIEGGDLDQERGMRILELLQGLLDEDPPPHDPPHNSEEPRPRLFLFASLHVISLSDVQLDTRR